MKVLTLLLLIPSLAMATEEVKPAPPPESVDISNLEDDYWRPNKDELEVVQNRRFEKKGRFEVGVHYGILQGEDFENSTTVGVSAAYNLTNQWFIEASHHNYSNKDNDFLNALKARYGFTPDFNRVSSQSAVQLAWVPIYAKFSLLGKKISHFELYLAAGPGITKTTQNHFSGLFTVGNKFYITENLLFRVEWRMTRYEDRVTTKSGSTSVANGGRGYVDQTETTHNIIFGLGWMF